MEEGGDGLIEGARAEQCIGRQAGSYVDRFELFDGFLYFMHRLVGLPSPLLSADRSKQELVSLDGRPKRQWQALVQAGPRKSPSLRRVRVNH